MVQFNVEPLIEEGNRWMHLGDELHLHATSMDGTVSGMAWTSAAGRAAREAWNSRGDDVHGSLQASAETAWRIGDAFQTYAEELQKAIHEINKQRLVAAVANIFGVALLLLTVELLPIIGPLIESLIELMAGAVAFMAAFEAAMASLGLVGEFAFGAVIGASFTLGFDMLIQAMAHAATQTKFQVDWKSEAINMGLGAAAGVAMLGEHWMPPSIKSAPPRVAQPGKGAGGIPPTPGNLPNSRPFVILPISGIKVPLPGGPKGINPQGVAAASGLDSIFHATAHDDAPIVVNPTPAGLTKPSTGTGIKDGNGT
ncbi:hypothetical protein ACWGJV_38385, partial [Streptomyces tendae]